MQESNGTRIVPYEDWMGPQVIELLASVFARDLNDEAVLFRRLFEHPFQRDRALRVVAIDGDRVCGFQSYLFWPYKLGARELESYQSARSAVSPLYRGQGVFARLLQYQWPTVTPEVITGFPVAASYGSLVRNGWVSPLDLEWFVRFMHAGSQLTGQSRAIETRSFDLDPVELESSCPPDSLALSKDVKFREWRLNYSIGLRRPTYFHFVDGDEVVQFEVKVDTRRRARFLVIGDIVRSSLDDRLLRGAMRALVGEARKDRSLAGLAIALNRGYRDTRLLRAVRHSGFIRVRRRGIHFMVKPRGDDGSLAEPGNWWLLRGDIDSW